jgi:hypothetical protein
MQALMIIYIIRAKDPLLSLCGQDLARSLTAQRRLGEMSSDSEGTIVFGRELLIEGWEVDVFEFGQIHDGFYTLDVMAL